jgi:DeoR family fructose operon transcriptional repressor
MIAYYRYMSGLETVNDNLVPFAPERRERLRRIVQTRRSVRVEELKDELGVSLATIRRDLDELEDQGDLRRVHGGAVTVGERPIEAHFDTKAAVHEVEKRRIAERALDLVGENETIYVDSGSTCLELARLLAGRDDLTVVTNSVPAIVALSGGGPRVIVIGGELRPLSQAIVGPLSLPLIETLYVDRAFMGTFSLSLDAGLTTTDPGEAFTKGQVLDRAREVVLLADSSKLGTRALAHAGRLDEIDILVTDVEPDASTSEELDLADVRVLVA